MRFMPVSEIRKMDTPGLLDMFQQWWDFRSAFGVPSIPDVRSDEATVCIITRPVKPTYENIKSTMRELIHRHGKDSPRVQNGYSHWLVWLVHNIQCCEPLAVVDATARMNKHYEVKHLSMYVEHKWRVDNIKDQWRPALMLNDMRSGLFESLTRALSTWTRTR